MTDNTSSSAIPLGKETSYPETYDPTLLYPIARSDGRTAAGLVTEPSRWLGEDIWNIYELSWLEKNGKPQVGMAELRVPASSPNLIESKSLKLYCNSFAMTRFSSPEIVCETMERDLGKAAGQDVTLRLIPAKDFYREQLSEPEGVSLDELDINVETYSPHPAYLKTENSQIEQTLFSRLFRSCCPVTGQPDWATVMIRYGGLQIDPSGLLAYLISFRQHTGFHEACVETIFTDIMEYCRPETLTVSARFTRRGGIDINPYRSTQAEQLENLRDPRQ